MCQFLLMLPLLAGVVPARDDVPPYEDAKTVQASLQGEWRMIHAVVRGKDEDRKKIDGTTLTIKGNQMNVREPQNQKPETASFTIDLSKKPAAFDIHLPVQPGSEELKIAAIFKIEGDVLTICFIRGGGSGGMLERPIAFVSSPDTNKDIALLQFRRKGK